MLMNGSEVKKIIEAIKGLNKEWWVQRIEF